MRQRPVLILCMGVLLVTVVIACQRRMEILERHRHLAGSQKTYKNVSLEGTVCAIEETDRGTKLCIKGRCKGRALEKEDRDHFAKFIVFFRQKNCPISRKATGKGSDLPAQTSHFTAGRTISEQSAQALLFTSSIFKKGNKQNKKPESVYLGNRVRVKGDFCHFRVARNRGNFDEYLYYKSCGFGGTLLGKELTVTGTEKWELQGRLLQWKQAWKDRLLFRMGKRYGGVMAGVLLGEKREIPEEIKELFQMTGIGHILVISGLHISFLGWAVYQMGRRVTGSFLAGGVAGWICLGIYVLMTGVTVSSLRAVLFFGFRIGAEVSGRAWDKDITFWVSAAILLGTRPEALFDVGFLLSFGTIFSLWKVAPLLFPKKRSYDIPGRLWRGICSGAAICLTLLPLLCWHFFEYSFWSILWNLLVVPLASLLLLAGFLGSLLDMAGGGGGCFALCKGILYVYEKGSGWLGRLPWGHMVIGQPEPWKVAGYYVLVAAGLFLLKKAAGSGTLKGKRKDPRRKIALVSILAGMSLLLWKPEGGGNLQIFVLDIGQGDCTFIRGEKGGTYLIDGGSTDVKKVGKYRIRPFLKSQGITKLDYVLISHGDMDHNNGVEELLQDEKGGIRVEKLVLPPENYWEERLARLAQTAKLAGVPVYTINQGDEIREGKLRMTCLFPTKEERGIQKGNEASMVLEIRYGDFEMLLTGDLEKEGEKIFLKEIGRRYQKEGIDVLKVAHHGSRFSTSREFLNSVHPRYAVISAGVSGRYGHPHKEVLKRLRQKGSRILQTSKTGEVFILVEEETMHIGSRWQPLK